MDIDEFEISNNAINTERSKASYRYIKRGADVLFSLCAIFILSPIFIIVSVFIKVETPKGSVFFKQNRVGINGKIFKMYKFRSMHPNAEELLEKIKHLNEVEGNMFKIKEDPRITKVGKFIRGYSIDELPQLINVLKGDMSLIGPRPPLIREFNLYSENDKKRLLIHPGITGLWQVSGRNSLTFKEMVDLDLKYISELSILNDVKIFFKTIIVVIKKENAY